MNLRRVIYPLAVAAAALVVWLLSPPEPEPAPPPETGPRPAPETRSPHRGQITALAIQGDTLLSGDSRGTLARWDLAAEGALLDHWAAHDGGVRQVAASEGGWMSVSADGTVAWWAPDTRIQTRQRLKGRSLNGGVQVDALAAVVVADDGAVARLEGSEMPWREKAVHNLGALAVTRSPDGALVATGGVDGTVAVWHPNGLRHSTWVAHQGWVTALYWAGDGIITASADHTAAAWTLPRSGTSPETQVRPRVKFAGHTDTVLALDVEGDLLVTGGLDGAVRLWSLDTGEARGRLDVGEPVYSLALHGGHLITGSGDATLRLWQIDGLKPVATLPPDPEGAP